MILLPLAGRTHVDFFGLSLHILQRMWCAGSGETAVVQEKYGEIPMVE
jgi:hypothetical protein